MMIEPVVLPSGACAACHNEPEAVICGYYGVCPFCNSGGSEVRSQALELQNAQYDLADKDREIRELKREIDRLKEDLANAEAAFQE